MRFDFDQVFPGSTKTKRGASSPVIHSSTTAIALPEIGTEVARKYTFQTNRPNKAAWELLLLAIAEVSPIDDKLVSQALAKVREPCEIASDAVKHYITHLIGDLGAIDLGIEVCDDWMSPYSGSDHETQTLCERDKVNFQQPHLIIATAERAKQQRLLQPVFERLVDPIEKALFYRAYRMLHWFQWRFLVVTTPAFCKFIAERHYWEWEAGEQEYYRSAREYREPSEAKELLKHINSDEMYRYKNLLGSFGGLLFSPRGSHRLKNAEIDVAADGHISDAAARMAVAIKAAVHCIRTAGDFQVPSLEDFDEEPIGSAVYLRWNETDDTVRINDDFNYDMMNAGYNTTEYFGVRSMLVSDIGEARNFLNYLQRMAIELKAVHGLVAAISEPYTSN